MSAWGDRTGKKGSAVAGVGGGRNFGASSGLPSSTGGVYHPTPSGGAPAPDPIRPGSVNINLLDPAQTASEGTDAISSLFDGLRQGLVGTSEGRDAEGFQDKSVIGSVPVLGDVARAGANILGGAGEVFGGAVSVVGGTLERLPSQGSQGGTHALDQAYKDPALQAWLDEKDPNTGEPRRAQFTGDKGILGTGILSNEEHFKSAALRAYAEDQQFEKPTLSPGAFTTPGSLAGTIMNMFDVLEAGQEWSASKWAQLDTPGQAGMDRIDFIMAVGDGDVAFNPDEGILGTGVFAGDPSTDLNPLEELVYQKVTNGDWSRDEAADFLASNGQAFGHTGIANIGGAIALDPLNVAAFGGSAVAKLGSTGAKVAKTITGAERLLVEAEDVVKAAKLARKGLRNPARIAAAKKAIRVAQSDVRKAKKAVALSKEYHSTGSGISKLNPIARKAEGSTKMQSAMQYAGKAYGALEGTTVGRAAKITRTIIDPLHGLDMGNPGAARMVDLYSDALPRSVVDVAGVQHYKGMLDDAIRTAGDKGEQMDAMVNDIAVASANMGREGVIDLYRAAQINAGLGEELMKTLPEDLQDLAVASVKQRDLEKWLRASTTKHVIQETWTNADHATLAKQLEQAYHFRSEAEWLEYLKTASKEQKSLYKLAAYGRANTELLDFVGRAKGSAELAAKLPFPAERMVLLAKGTLSRVGADSLLTQLSMKGGKKALKRKLSIIRAWQEQYPSLRYITIDPANLERSVDNFVEYLKDNIERYPMQMTSDEIANLGDDATSLTDAIGEYAIGFRPKDEFLWGLERENGTGLYRPAGAAFADHVGTGSLGYRPMRALRTNILGHPIVDMPVLRAGARIIDHMDSAARIMKGQVTGSMIAEAARKRFVSRAVTGDLAEHGVTEQVANSWFERITQYSREHQGYSGPRGYGGDDLFTAIKEKNLIPQALLNGDRRLNPDDIMRLVMEAYDGDIRTIGLTQKLSGRAKRYLFEATGSNFAGQIAEHAWPTLKFRYNPLFQLQEKIEPWVLNTQRGVSSALHSGMSEADRATESLLQRMSDNSLVRQSDLDQYEYSSEVLMGGLTRKTAMRPGSALNRMQRAAKTITDVQGMKRVNMLRTFRKGLGKDIREAWDHARPGEFDQMLEHASAKSGRVISEDEFALQMVTENMYANDVIISRLEKGLGAGGLKADWANSIKTGKWMSPTHMGELQALDLDHIAASLRIISKDGREIGNLTDLRQALATEPDMMDKIKDGLTRLGADKDYIRRVEHGLNFSWNGFWRTAAKRFSLTSDESRALQDMMAESAKLRGMTPVEFMSQVFSPSLIDGEEGILGHLDGAVGIIREARASGRKISPKAARLTESRTKLAGKEGVSTREDLVRQISRTFSAHLDPSAKRALLLEFRPELKKAVLRNEVRLEVDEINKMWDSLAENQLADRILGFMDGVQPVHPFEVLDDAARGAPDVRNAYVRYMQRAGVEPLSDGNHFVLDASAEAHYEQGAAHYSALPEIEYHRTGRIPNKGSLNKSGTDLKPKPEGVDDATYASYESAAIDVRNQFDFMTAPKSKGGLGLEVTVSKTEPYADVPGPVSVVPDDGVLRTFDDVQRAIAGEDTDNLFLRWTPDIEKERVPGFSSRHSHDRTYVEGGVSALPMRGIDEGFGFDTRWSQSPGTSGPRSYYLVRGEALLDVNGKRAFGASNEVLLKPESMVPIATIDRQLVDEGFDVFRGKKPVPPTLPTKAKAGGAAAMRADLAKGRLKVFGGNSDHPLLTNDQNVMMRATHQVFGYGGEGFEYGVRGDLNAAAAHARMFSNEGRPAMLTETHGQSSYAHYSDDAYDPTGVGPRRTMLDPTRAADDFERMHPFDPNESALAMMADPDFPADEVVNGVVLHGKDATGKAIKVVYRYNQRIGDGLRVMDPSYQRAILQPISDLLQEFPDLKVKHVDMISFNEPLDVIDTNTISGMGYGDSASALTWAGDEGEAVIIFNKDFYDAYGGPNWGIDSVAKHEASRSSDDFWSSFTGKREPRQSNVGTPGTANAFSPAYISRHETGHAFDSMRRPREWDGKKQDWVLQQPPPPGQEQYYEMMARFEKTGASMDLSEYGLSNSQEFGAELFAFSTDPRYDVTKIKSAALLDMSQEYRQYLIDSGEWQPLREAIDTSRIVDNLPDPGFARSRVFVGHDGTANYRMSGEWGPGMYVSTSPDDAVQAGSNVASYTVNHDDVLDLRALSRSDGSGYYADAVAYGKAHNGGNIPPELEDLGQFIEDLGLDPALVTSKDIHRMAAKKPSLFHKALADANYSGFRTADSGIVITDPTKLTRESDNVLALKNPAPPAETTVRAANAAKRGTVSAPKKVGLLPQEYLDDFANRFIGKGKHVESNPDVSRAAQMFGKWTDAVVNNGLLKKLDGGSGIHANLLADIAALPTGAAVPYNFTEGMAINLATQSMVRKWDDAFRLQYFSQERSILERSMNHPMFGLYPASYMWGKIMPEMVKFIAAQPFGNKTGGLLKTAMDAQVAIALRREQDPAFDQNIEDLGHSQALSFGGYLLPSLPWDIGASAPSWMTSIAQQGLSNAKKVEAGTPDKQKDISLIDPIKQTFQKLAPLTTSVPWIGRAIDELNGQTEEEKLRQQVQTDKAVQAAELSPFMARAMQELREALK